MLLGITKSGHLSNQDTPALLDYGLQPFFVELFVEYWTGWWFFSTHLKNIYARQIGSIFPGIGVKMKNV